MPAASQRSHDCCNHAAQMLHVPDVVLRMMLLEQVI